MGIHSFIMYFFCPKQHSMRPFNIIVAEDDNWYAEYINHHLLLETKHNITRVSSAAEIFKLLKTKPDLITLDYNLPDMKGDETLKRIKNESKERTICDFIAGMTDRFAINLYNKIK